MQHFSLLQLKDCLTWRNFKTKHWKGCIRSNKRFWSCKNLIFGKHKVSLKMFTPNHHFELLCVGGVNPVLCRCEDRLHKNDPTAAEEPWYASIHCLVDIKCLLFEKKLVWSFASPNTLCACIFLHQHAENRLNVKHYVTVMLIWQWRHLVTKCVTSPRKAYQDIKWVISPSPTNNPQHPICPPFTMQTSEVSSDNFTTSQQGSFEPN